MEKDTKALPFLSFSNSSRTIRLAMTTLPNSNGPMDSFVRNVGTLIIAKES